MVKLWHFGADIESLNFEVWWDEEKQKFKFTNKNIFGSFFQRLQPYLSTFFFWIAQDKTKFMMEKFFYLSLTGGKSCSISTNEKLTWRSTSDEVFRQQETIFLGQHLEKCYFVPFLFALRYNHYFLLVKKLFEKNLN